MTVTLDLKPEMEARLALQARAQGVPVETYLLHMIEGLLALPPAVEEDADILEDDIPIIQPRATRRVKMHLVPGGTFTFPSLDERDQVDQDA